jgi:hypothetical protein
MMNGIYYKRNQFSFEKFLFSFLSIVFLLKREFSKQGGLGFKNYLRRENKKLSSTPILEARDEHQSIFSKNFDDFNFLGFVVINYVFRIQL